MLYLSYTPSSSFFTPFSASVHFRDCRKKYFVPQLFISMFRRNISNNFVSYSKNHSYSSPAEHRKQFRIFLLGSDLSLANTFWICFSNSGISRIKCPSFRSRPETHCIYVLETCFLTKWDKKCLETVHSSDDSVCILKGQPVPQHQALKTCKVRFLRSSLSPLILFLQKHTVRIHRSTQSGSTVLFHLLIPTATCRPMYPSLQTNAYFGRHSRALTAFLLLQQL